MDTSEFVEFAKATIDYVANYTETLRSRNVLPDIEPDYLSKCLPKVAPENPEKWEEVLKDVEQYIMPGVYINKFLIFFVVIEDIVIH